MTAPPTGRDEMPADVESAWFTIARYVGIPGESAARQLGVLRLAKIALVSGEGEMPETVREAIADVRREEQEEYRLSDTHFSLAWLADDRDRLQADLDKAQDEIARITEVHDKHCCLECCPEMERRALGTQKVEADV